MYGRSETEEVVRGVPVRASVRTAGMVVFLVLMEEVVRLYCGSAPTPLDARRCLGHAGKGSVQGHDLRPVHSYATAMLASMSFF